METEVQSHSSTAQMLANTNAYLDDHISVWIAVPIISNYKNKIHELVLACHTLLDQQNQEEAPRSSQAVLRLKQQIANKMDILDDTLEAYADDIGDGELKTLAENHYSDYYALPYEQFENKVSEIIELLETHVNDMGEYGLVKDQIDDVKWNMDEYQIGLGKSITYKISHEMVSQDLGNLMQEALKFADKLDHVMKRFKRSNQTFYYGYLATREQHSALEEAYA